jgi:hypothetical protein
VFVSAAGVVINAQDLTHLVVYSVGDDALWFEAGAGGGALPSLTSCPPGEAREQHRDDASDATDRGDRRAEPADSVKV